VLREIPHHLEITPGDTIYTSGHSSIFPADIPLGTVRQAEIVNGATYDIEVDLFEDFGALRHACIVENIAKEEMNTLENK
jgi:rod shape-determining protein MreC